jgi:hypothetical protein
VRVFKTYIVDDTGREKWHQQGSKTKSVGVKR